MEGSGNVLRTDYYTQLRTVGKELARVNHQLATAISDRVALDEAVKVAVAGSDDQLAARQRCQWNEEAQHKLIAEQLPLMRQRQRLHAAEAEGLAFERTEGFAFVNRILPRVPEGAREVSVTTLLRKPVSRRVRFAGVAAGSALVILVAATIALLPPWASGDAFDVVVRLVGGHSEPHKPNGFAFTLTGVVVAGVVLWALFSPALGTANLLERQHRYFLGAGSWSWRERLTACCGYAVGSWWTFLCPLVAIPVRFCLALVNTLLQIRVYDEKRPESVTEGVRVSTQFTRSFTRQVMLVGGLTFLIAMF